MPAPASQQTPQRLLKTLTFIHAALVTGQVLFAVIALLQHQAPHSGATESNGTFRIIVPAMAVASFLFSQVLFKKRLTSVPVTESLSNKLTGYQTALITRMALLEGASLFGISTYFITGNPLYISISALLIAYFIWLRPTRQKIADELQLSYKEKMELDGTDKIS